MARHQVSFLLTIPISTTDSNIVTLAKPGQSIVDMVIFGPSALTGTCTLYLGATDTDDTVAEMLPAYLNGANVTLAAAKANVVPIGSFRTIAIVSGSSEGAARIFKVVCQLEL